MSEINSFLVSTFCLFFWVKRNAYWYVDFTENILLNLLGISFSVSQESFYTTPGARSQISLGDQDTTAAL